MHNYNDSLRGHTTFDRDDHENYLIDATSNAFGTINDALAADLQDRPVYDKMKGTYGRIDGVSTE